MKKNKKLLKIKSKMLTKDH